MMDVMAVVLTLLMTDPAPPDICAMTPMFWEISAFRSYVTVAFSSASTFMEQMCISPDCLSICCT